MAKQSTHSELQQLFEIAKRDVPTGAEVEQLQISVLSALRAGTVPQSALQNLALDEAPHRHALWTKLIVSIGIAGLLAAGVAGLRHHWRHAPPAVAPSVSPVVSATASSELTLRAAPPPLPTASVNQIEPQPAVSTTADTPTTPVHRTGIKPPASEAEMIEQARQLLQDNPARALALTKKHRRLYPSGVLAPEREVIAIEALARLGKSQAAEKRAEAFRAAEPNSIHDLRLRSSLGDAGAKR